MTTETKDSGVKWIGTVPADWTLLKMKHCSYMKGRIGWQGLTADEFIEEGPYLVTGTDFERGRVCWDRSYHISEKRYNEAVPIQLKVGDLLVTKDGTIGKLAYIDELPGKVSLNSHLLVIRPVGGKYINRFLYWVLGSSVFQGYYELVSYGSTMDSLSQEKIGEFEFYAPPIDEQRAIAAFLDAECDKIDSIIDDLERQIELLQQYRRMIVTETITKGLDDSVGYKDSGIPWYGKIPKHYELKRLKYLLRQNCVNMRVGPFGSALSADDIKSEGYWVYNQRCVLDENFEENDSCVDAQKFAELKTFRVYPGDLLITTRGTIGRIAIAPTNTPIGILHPCIIRFVVDETLITNELVKMIFNDSNIVRDQLFMQSNATTIDVIYSYTLKNILLPVIPHKEQQRIIEFIKEKCTKIDGVLHEKELQLEKAKAEKYALIYEYVTGKKRVKEVMSYAK